MRRCEITCEEAELAERAACEICRASYDAMLRARRASPRDAAQLLECRRLLRDAELRHGVSLAKLWRARKDGVHV